MHRCTLRASGALLLPFLTLLHAQPTQPATGSIALAGSGYRIEGVGVWAAPGQVMLISLLGLKAVVPQPEMAVSGPTGLPKTLAGVSVDFVQGSTVIPLDLRGIQQGTCALIEVCSTITSITLQIPFELKADVFPPPHLRIKENGTIAGAVALGYVGDRIHILNTCDSTQISIGAASSVPRDVCAAAVMVNGRLNSLYNLLRAGDVVSMWAFGLGAFQDKLVTAPLLLNFDFRPNAAAARGVAGQGVTAEPIYAGHIGVGSYQVNFAIPPVPAGTVACDGVNVKSNLTVTLSGPNSYDAAHLCVEP